MEQYLLSVENKELLTINQEWGQSKDLQLYKD